jgi:MSHA biogenesis protein MshO
MILFQDKSIKRQAGFTLIELVTVIVILGILSVGLSSFVKFGAQIFVDATDRDKILSSARFAIERLNRELRGSVPNSVRVSASGACLEFAPIAHSFVYIDIPVSPETNSATVTLVPTNKLFTAVEANNYSVVVYPLNSDDVYQTQLNKVFPLKSGDFSSTPHILTFDNAVGFKDDSTTQRLFIMKRSVMYCRENNNQLMRYKVDGHDTNGIAIITDKGTGVLMAEDLVAATFTVGEGSHLRNGTVGINFEFSRNNEVINFNNEVQVPNVP